MAVSETVVLKADSSRVWGTTVKLITGAGYPITRTDQAAKQIVYQASGGFWAWQQVVQVSVTEVDENETIVTIAVSALEQEAFGEGGRQRELIAFVVDDLKKRFEFGTPAEPSSAPGSAGCAILIAAALSLIGASAWVFC